MSLERTLKTRDLVLFNVAAIVGMRWVALAAHSGPSSIGLWILAAVAFFIPQGLAVTALSSSIPEEGGLYVWTTRAFGPRQGFLCGWLYWASNITYIPTLGLTTVVFALYTFNLRFAHLENNRTYAAGASLILPRSLAFNIVGLRLTSGCDIGGLARWVPSAVLLAVGIMASRAPARRLIPAAALLRLSPRDRSSSSRRCFGFAGLGSRR